MNLSCSQPLPLYKIKSIEAANANKNNNLRQAITKLINTELRILLT